MILLRKGGNRSCRVSFVSDQREIILISESSWINTFMKRVKNHINPNSSIYKHIDPFTTCLINVSISDHAHINHIDPNNSIKDRSNNLTHLKEKFVYKLTYLIKTRPVTTLLLYE